MRVGRLKTVFHADNEYMNLRVMVSGYNDLIGILNQEKNRLKSLFRQAAIRMDGSKIYNMPERSYQPILKNMWRVHCMNRYSFLRNSGGVILNAFMQTSGSTKR